MSRKTRRNQTGKEVSRREASAEARDQEASAAEETEAVQEAEASAESEEEPQRVSLPAFGFAEDLLRKPAESPVSESPASESSEVSAESESTAAESTAAESTAVTAAESTAADPHRIFAFADSVADAAEEQPEAAPVRLETWVAFSLAGEVFAVPVEPIREIVRVASITRVPHAPRPIRGVTNMRGRVIPVIDLQQRIGLDPVELGRGSRVIVVSSRGRFLGLLVDAVHQVIHIDLEQSQSPPEDVMTAQSDYISGVYHLEDQLILLLDLDRAMIIHDAVAPEIARDGNGQAAVDGAPAGAT